MVCEAKGFAVLAVAQFKGDISKFLTKFRTLYPSIVTSVFLLIILTVDSGKLGKILSICEARYNSISCFYELFGPHILIGGECYLGEVDTFVLKKEKFIFLIIFLDFFQD
mgnify:CR=1 FL=1